MIVGTYRIEKENGFNWKYLTCYKYSTSYMFLKTYFKDGTPYTLNEVSNLNKEDINCKSDKSRSYHDLISLAQNHVKDFSINKFNNDLLKLLIEGNLSVNFCNYINNYVFKYKKNYNSSYFHIVNNRLVFYKNSIEYFKGKKGSYKRILFDTIFRKALKIRVK